jgi:hypothetical protein
MTVTGSSLINTSSTGQPSDNEDRPFSFAMGTQIFINPSDDPTNAVLTFKVDPSLLAGTLASGTSNLAIGFAIDSQLNSLSSWGESFISTATPNIFGVGFGRLSTVPSQVAVNVQGTQVATIARPQDITGVDEASNTFTVNSHSFVTGDRILVSSTGTIPGGLAANAPYFIIVSSVNSIKFATSYANAVASSEIDIQTAGSGTITVASDEIFTLTRSGSSGNVTVKKGDVTVATFTNINVASPLRSFYWSREQSASNSLPVVKEIKVRGAI